MSESLAYIMPHPSHLKILELREVTYTLKNISMPQECQLITSIGWAQTLKVSVLGLAFERVGKQGVAALCTASRVNHNLYLGVPAPWSFDGSSASLQPSSLVWNGDKDFVRGNEGLHSLWRSSLIESGIKLTGNLA